MNRFRYAADPACLGAVVLYTLNRWIGKPWWWSGGFMHDHFNDLLLVPAALPLLLWVHRRLGWRTHDRAPGAWETGLHVVVWSVICEWVGPHFLQRGTADPGDVAVYVTGAVVAWVWWHSAAALRGIASRA